MNRHHTNRFSKLTVTLLAVLLLTAFMAAGCGQKANQVPGPSPSETPAPGASTGQPDISSQPAPSPTTVTLYFGDKEAMYLVPVEKQITKGSETLETAIINELIKGAGQEGLSRVIPAEARLLSVSVVDKVAYVNFSKEFKSKHWGGSAGETMTIFAVVNSLGKLPGIEKVQFLLEGQKMESILGNYDTSQPIRPDWDLVYKTDSGRYVGQIDGNSIEVKISGVPDSIAPRALRLSEAAKADLTRLNLKTGDQIKFNYYLNGYGQYVATQLTKL